MHGTCISHTFMFVSRMVMEARANLRNRTDNIFSKRVNDDPKRSAKNNFVI